MNADAILQREFLEIRAKILDIAASLDRIGRAEGNVSRDRRMALIRQGLAILAGEKRDRAEQVQLLFSRQYEDDWREKFDLAP